MAEFQNAQRRDWNPQFSLDRIGFAFHNPVMAFRILFGQLTYEETLRSLLNKDLAIVRKRYNSLFRDDCTFLEMSPQKLQKILSRMTPSNREFSWRILNRWRSFLYAAVRSANPSVVVETGVLYGASSAAILQGLEDNGAGKLISVDLPPQEHRFHADNEGRHLQSALLPGHSVGSAVSVPLRKRWELVLGDSLKVLPNILESSKPICMFIHDSLHTYNHMMKEYNVGYEALKKGGILVSDDIDYNSAWHEFCRSTNERGTELIKGTDSQSLFGFLVKS